MRSWRGPAVLAWAGAGVLALMIFVALAAPWISPYDPNLRSGLPFAAPDARHWLGTDDVGHDILSQLIYGARVSLLVGLSAAAVATGVGVLAGMMAGYRGGWLDAVVMRIVDVALSLPFLPLVIVAGVFFPGGVWTQVAIIAATLWALPAREIRPQVRSLSRRADVEAARVMGAKTAYLLRRHLLPSIAPLVPPQMVRVANLAILTEASLSFLGLGNAQRASWGTMLYYAHSRGSMLTRAWRWWVLPPGLCIAATVIALAFIGFIFEERLHPTLRGRRRRRRTGTPAKTPASAEAGNVFVLSAESLSFRYGVDVGGKLALDRVDLRVATGEVAGLVGRSGSGKTTMAVAALGLLSPDGQVEEGTVHVLGRDLTGMTADELRRMRGRAVALVPQDAMSALNPVVRVGNQLVEAIRIHDPIPRKDAALRARALLELVGIPAGRYSAFPHELSGGMRQRVVLAMALSNRPQLLVADEPTTGLDPIVRNELVELLGRLHRDLGMAILLISHDLQAVLRLAGRLFVLEEGKVVEEGPAERVAAHPGHPATMRLLGSRMGPGGVIERPPARVVQTSQEVLALQGLSKSFGKRSSRVAAVEDFDLTIGAGESVGLVGRSGAGKSTVARLVCGLEQPDAGRIFFKGADVAGSNPRARRAAAGGLHLVFQDPYEALPQNMQVVDIVVEPLLIQGIGTPAAHHARAREALAEVALDPDRFARRFPHELSGGERQRVALARALVARPSLVVADEPAAMLDAALAQDMAELISSLRQRHDMAWLLITHELLLASRVCDRLVIMADGRVEDDGPADRVLRAPAGRRAAELIAAAQQVTVNA